MKELFFTLLVYVGACSGEPDRPVTLPGGGPPLIQDIPCVDGAVKGCSIVTTVRDGYVDCAAGISVCANKEWGPCQLPDRVTSDSGPG